MSDEKTSIRLRLDRDLANGKAVDVDATARNLAELFPHLKQDDLAKLIFEVVVDAGGNASWGHPR